MSESPAPVPTLRDRFELSFLDKRVVLELRTGVPIILGRIGPEVRKLEEVIDLRHPVFGEIHASLLRVTPQVVWYRQIPAPDAIVPAFHPEPQ